MIIDQKKWLKKQSNGQNHQDYDFYDIRWIGDFNSP